MCGLVGMVGTLEHKHKQAMKELLFLDTLRGKDSTGLAAVKRNRSVLTRKMTIPGYEFIEHPLVERAMSHNDQLWIGHNRFKTTGDISRSNAHPFEVLDDQGDIILIGAHNGTLTNKYELDRLIGGDKLDTDSEALFNYLTIAPTFKEAIGKARGAWSLVFWDPTTDSLHFLRNEERPLVYAYSKDHKVLVWASEAWMLINACRRNGVELAQNDKGLSCYSTVTDNLYTLEIPQKEGTELPELKREGGFTGLPVSTFQQGRGQWNSWWSNGHDDNWDDEGPVKEAAKAANEKGKAKGTEGNVVTLGYPPRNAPAFRGLNGKPLTGDALELALAGGCRWCGNTLALTDKYTFIEEDAPVCLHCVYDNHPKDGDRVRRGEDDDDLAGIFDELDEDEDFDPAFGVPYSEGSPEYERLMHAAATRAASKAIG
jgi:predicted glutamine amidotransferase